MIRKVTAIGVSLLSLGLVASVLAQPSAPTQYLQLVEINVKAGAEAQFESYVLKVREAADKVGATQRWTFAQPVIGASGPTYYVILGYEKWGERDGWSQIPQMLTQAFGEAEAQKIAKAGGDSIWGTESTVYNLDRERSWNLGIYQPAPYYSVLRGKVKPGMVGEYLRVISRLKEAQEAAARKVPGIRRTSAYGPSWEFYMATPMQKWSDMDAPGGVWPNVASAFGETEARGLQETLRNCYEERTLVVIAVRPDLSRLAPTSTSND